MSRPTSTSIIILIDIQIAKLHNRTWFSFRIIIIKYTSESTTITASRLITLSRSAFSAIFQNRFFTDVVLTMFSGLCEFRFRLSVQCRSFILVLLRNVFLFFSRRILFRLVNKPVPICLH